MIDNVVQEKITALFSSFNHPGSPGCALGIFRDREVVYSQGYGLANLEHNVTITPSTPFYIASMAKQFTGLAIAMLASEGRLNLDADIRTILPYVPDFGHTITARHLLHHTSGLRSDIFLLILAGWRVEDVIRQEDIINFVKDQRELDFVPGEEFSYCGTGYSLLAEIVAEISGQSFAEYCTQRIFNPLGMERTHVAADPIALVPSKASAYLSVGEGEYKNAVLTISILGGTGIYSTIEDLARWDANFETHEVGDQAAWDLVCTPGQLNSGESIPYGFGLVVDAHQGKPTLHHGGDSAGVHCYFLRFPEESLSVVILGNASTIKASNLVYEVADLLLDIDQPSANDSPQSAAPLPAKLSAERIAARASRYYDARTGAFVDLLLHEGILSVYGYELVPISDDEYFLKQHPSIRIKFSESEDGTIQASVDFGTGPATYQKVESVEPSSEELSAYIGSYHSEELDVTWLVTLEDDQLIVHRKRQGISKLVPICEDVFADPWAGDMLHGNAQWVIAFDRTDEAITGLRVTADGARGRNLRFDKQE